jgi:hypothetical protein
MEQSLMQELKNNPLFTAEESDDESNDRRLQTAGNQSRVAREPENFLQPSKRPKKAKNTAAFDAGQSLVGNKLFGAMDISKFVGADEARMQEDNNPVLADHSNLCLEFSQREKKAKVMEWDQKSPLKQVNDQHKRLTKMEEEHQYKQSESRFLNGVLNQAMLFDKNEDFDVVIEGELDTRSLFNPNHMHLKRAANGNSPRRGADELRKVLARKIESKKGNKNITAEDLKYFKETDFTREDEEQEKQEALEEKQREKRAEDEHLEKLGFGGMAATDDAEDEEDGDYAPSEESGVDQQTDAKLDTEQIIRLEEGEENDDYCGNAEERQGVQKRIADLEEELLSDDSFGSEEGEVFSGEEAEEVNESQISRDDEQSQSECSENLPKPEGGATELSPKKKQLQYKSGTFPLDRADDHLMAEENSGVSIGEVKLMKRLKKMNVIKEEKEVRRKEKKLQKYEEIKQNMKNLKKKIRGDDLGDNEADLGEVVDGRDGEIKPIDVSCKVTTEPKPGRS